MTKLSRVTRMLTRGQRISRDADAVASGKPSHIVRRIKNRVLGRSLRGVFRWLWK